MRSRGWVLLWIASLAAARAEDNGDPAKPATPPPPLTLAIVIHPKNPVTTISFRELRSYMKMERQFWANQKRCRIYLPASHTPEFELLLGKVYKMSRKKLQKYWVRKLFSGEIPAKPSHVPSAKAAGSQVLRSIGGLSVVASKEIPPKVRVLMIDGKKPGDKGYPLVAAPPKR